MKLSYGCLNFPKCVHFNGPYYHILACISKSLLLTLWEVCHNRVTYLNKMKFVKPVTCRYRLPTHSAWSQHILSNKKYNWTLLLILINSDNEPCHCLNSALMRIYKGCSKRRYHIISTMHCQTDCQWWNTSFIRSHPNLAFQVHFVPETFSRIKKKNKKKTQWFIVRYAQAQRLNVDPQPTTLYRCLLTTMAKYHTINHFDHNRDFAAKKRLPYTFHIWPSQPGSAPWVSYELQQTISRKFLVQGNF